VPAARAARALSLGDPQKAIDLLEIPASYEFVGPTGAAMSPVYLRGEAYLAEGKAAEALIEFQKIVAHPVLTVGEPIAALVHIEMGRAYKVQGNTVTARESYQKFLTLWQQADPDIPILQQAKAEYAKL
jgi:eukaryotic-like serine/threonine-protein kinase